MALSASVLGSLIKSEIESAFGAPADSAALKKFCDALGVAIVSHIVAEAVVTVTGITPGPGSAPGTIQ